MEHDVVGFHAQQAVEKAIKVSLVLHDIDFPNPFGGCRRPRRRGRPQISLYC